jgi:hypothetical protein
MTKTFVYGSGSFRKRLQDEGLDVPVKCHNSGLATGFVAIFGM